MHAIIALLLADVCIVIPWSSATDPLGLAWGELSVAQRVAYMISMESWVDINGGAYFGDALGGIAWLYNILFSILCIATPIAAGVTAYSLVTRKFADWRIAMKMMVHCKLNHKDAPIYIFEGVNTRTLTYIRSIFEGGDRDADLPPQSHYLCVITGVNKDMREKNSGDIDSIRRWPVYLTDLSAHELGLRVKKHLRDIPELHACFFAERADAVGDPEGGNVSDAVQFIELLAHSMPEKDEAGFSRFTPDGDPRYHIHVACRGKSDELLFDSVEGSDGFDIHVMDEGREVIYDLLWRHPLYEVLTVEPRRLIERARSSAEENSDDDAQARLVVLIFGWGHYGFEAFRACAWSGQVPGVRLHIHVIDKRPKTDFEKFLRHHCPGFFESVKDGKTEFPAAREVLIGQDGKPHPAQAEVGNSLFDYTYHKVDALSSDLEDCIKLIRENCIVRGGGQQITPYCIVTLGDDDINTDTAIDVKRQFCGDGKDPAIMPRIYVDIYDERRHATFRKLVVPQKGGADNIGQELLFEPFGGIASIFTESYAAHSAVSRLALNANASYSQQFDPKAEWVGERAFAPASGQERRKNYTEFSRWQMFRLSNITNSMAVKLKLWLLGCHLDEKGTSDPAAISRLQHTLDKHIGSYEAPTSVPAERSQLEIMARGEHDRWVAFYLAEGWRYESAETSNTFRKQGLNDRDKQRHDSHLLLRHPYICDFDDLIEVAKAIGKGDPTVYDVRFIRDLARVVSDSRGFAKRRFGVIEAQPWLPGMKDARGTACCLSRLDR